MYTYNKLEGWDNWYLQDQISDLENKSFEAILKHMLIRFEQDFGKEFLEKEDCYIYIDRKFSCPMLVLNRPNLEIALTVKSTEYWCQVIYQLSHELCHYILRQASNGKKSLKWFEETLCESMSLYILDFFKETWSDCLLSKDDKLYFKNIEKYLKQIIGSYSTSGLKDCNSKESLCLLNKTCCENRSSRFNERNYIYNLFKNNRESIRLISQYQKYVMEELIIDFERWEKDTNKNVFISKLSKIQPNII